MSDTLNVSWQVLKEAAAQAAIDADAEARAADITPAGLLKRLRVKFTRRATVKRQGLFGSKRVSGIRVRGLRLRAGASQQAARRKLGA